MSRIVWDTTLWIGRTGQLRIVDASSQQWGHINVDDIRFDWAMQGYVESTAAGAVYVWRRKRGDASVEPCNAPADMPAYLQPWTHVPLECDYQFQQKLLVR